MAALDGLVRSLVSGARWLALPVVLLLFLQWPLREVVRGFSREANDLGQWLFALFVAVSITAATRAGVHLRPDGPARRFGPRTRRRLDAAAAGLVLAPWSILVLVAGWPGVSASVGLMERFPDTGNPGYFVVKLAGLLLAALVLVQAALDVAGALRRP